MRIFEVPGVSIFKKVLIFTLRLIATPCLISHLPGHKNQEQIFILSCWKKVSKGSGQMNSRGNFSTLPGAGQRAFLPEDSKILAFINLVLLFLSQTFRWEVLSVPGFFGPRLFPDGQQPSLPSIGWPAVSFTLVVYSLPSTPVDFL